MVLPNFFKSVRKQGNTFRLFGKKHKNIAELADDLPLFANIKAKEPEPAVKPAAIEALEALNPDDLTPREALDRLYEIKSLL